MQQREPFSPEEGVLSPGAVLGRWQEVVEGDPDYGDVIYVEWVDITTDPLGSVEEGDITTLRSTGYFVGLKQSEQGSFLLISDTITKGGEYYGYTAFPVGCVNKVWLVDQRE